MDDMEKVSERGESFDTVWIGKSKLPSASMVRTQPVLENSYLPRFFFFLVVGTFSSLCGTCNERKNV